MDSIYIVTYIAWNHIQTLSEGKSKGQDTEFIFKKHEHSTKKREFLKHKVNSATQVALFIRMQD